MNMHYPESYRQHRPGALPGVNAKGFSIVELLVAMVITLILLGGLFQVYLSNKVTYKFGEALSRVQENGRFAMDYLGTELRMADYWGCAASAEVENRLDEDEPGYIDFTAGGVDGFNGTEINGSDSITVTGMGGSQFAIRTPYMADDTATLQVPKNANLEEGEIVLVSDCLVGDVFQITSVTAGQGANASEQDTIAHALNNAVGDLEPGNEKNILSASYEGSASLGRATSKTFDLANNPIGEPALYVTVNGATSELVEGVENMQILYGEDTDGDLIPDRYRPANTVTDMGAVIAVRISLLIRSFQDNVVDDPQTYTYNGATVTAGDRRLRQVFTSTITLRNRTK